MNKDKYYKELHDTLALKYKTLPRVIQSIRILTSLGYGQAKMISRAVRKKRNSVKYIEYYSELLRFLLSIDDKEIIEICMYKGKKAQSKEQAMT